MTVHFENLPQATLYPEAFGLPAPHEVLPRDMWPRKPGVFIRRAPGDTTPETSAGRELVAGQFGLVPPWVKSASDAKLRSPKLVTARSETVTTSKNFRDAWLKGQRCIVPMMAFFEDDHRSGKAVPTRIVRVDGQPMGVAGLWERWTGADGAEIIDRKAAASALARLDVDEHGLDSLDRRYLRALIENYAGGPAGVETLAYAIAEAKDAVEDVIEPFLLQQGFIQRTPRGRVACARAYEHMGLAAPAAVITTVQGGLFEEE